MGFFSIKNGFSAIETNLFGANIGRPHFFINFHIFSLISRMICGTLQLMLNSDNLCVQLYSTPFAGWRERRTEGKGNKSAYFPAFSAGWKLAVGSLKGEFFVV
jgi:hypothetical protein